MNEAQARPNRLIAETSPYLLQHAYNPVDWHPWNPEALERARRENKPILLSVGYSACHWCHVMAHESFEDADTAKLMNELFVCIKVDREERPDLDKIYQIAHQMLAQRAGGWPLTMFLTPADHTPFFGGTYFPKEPRYGMPAFGDLLRRVADYYREHHAELHQQNAALKQAFDRLQPAPAASAVALKPELLQAARTQLEQQFDSVHGGFGSAPKFPHPSSIERCLRHWAASALPGGARPDEKALAMARFTLQKMARGGIYDQLGGGFYRYAVDEKWMIPHFEKMLYDNGPLLALYAAAALATGDGLFRRVALETGEWVQREMQSPEGGYYSSLDADSEGHEGKFYVWTREEVQALLSEEEFRVAAAHYGLEQPPNFENRWWHLYVHEDIEAVAKKLGISEQRAIVVLTSARQKLLAAREQRVRPGRDEKILTAWNGLMIKGMAAAGRLLGRTDFVDSAGRALDFIYQNLWRQGRLLVTYKDGKAQLNAYLDDYAFLLEGVLELLQARWRTQDLEFCRALADTILERFEDKQHGGFYFTADDHEKLLYRLKPVHDESMPAGNGVAAHALLRLGHLLADNRYLAAAERTLKALYADAARYPAAHNTLLNALEEYLNPPQLIVLRGEPAALQPWLARCLRHYAPRRMVFAIPPQVRDLPEGLAARAPRAAVTAYVCNGHACSAPISDLAALAPELAAVEAAHA